MFLKRSCIRGAAAVGIVGLPLLAMAAGPSPQSGKVSVDKAKAVQMLAKAANRFTENAGQWDKEARFASLSSDVDVWVTRSGANFDFHRSLGATRMGQVVRMGFAGGASSPISRGSNPDAGTYTYALEGLKRKGVAHRYESVWQRDVYPGVDVHYYTETGRPRYDLVVAPGADASRIGLTFAGASKVSVTPTKVVLGTQLGDVAHTKLFAYQLVNGAKKPIHAKFARRKDGSVGFAFGAYDHSKALVIDPLVYGSYYGGEGGWDEVRSVVADSVDGGVFLVGSTMSRDFIALQGPYSFNLQGARDGFIAKLRGDAYQNIYATFIGGSLSDYIQYAQVDPFGNLWVAGRTESSDFPTNTRPNIQSITMSGGATGGTFRLTYNRASTPALPFNISAANVKTALNNLSTLNGHVIDVTANGSFPNGTYTVTLDHTRPLAITASYTYVGDAKQTVNGEQLEGLAARYRIQLNNTAVPSAATADIIVRRGSVPTGGTFAISFNNPDPASGDPPVANVQTTTALAWNASGTTIQTALNKLTNLSNGTFTVTPAAGKASDGSLQITFTPQNGAPYAVGAPDAQGNPDIRELYISSGNSALLPRPTVTVSAPTTDIFVQRWARTSDGLLNPLPSQVLIFGGLKNETIAGFSVLQNDNPNPNDPVFFGFAGNTDARLAENTTDTLKAAYVARYTFDGTNITPVSVKYIGEGAPLIIGGFTIDRNGDSYIAGQLSPASGSNDILDPNASGDFTTVNPWPEGTLLRGQDMFVRKYNSDTTSIIYSGLIGGNLSEFVGGFDFDVDGKVYNTGSAIAVDLQGNAYVTGVTYSFNYPRTSGVFGETFTSNGNVVVTKISSDATHLVYSTNLKTSMDSLSPLYFTNQYFEGVGFKTLGGTILPAGIAVDGAGNAYVSGNAHPSWVNFPEPLGNSPGDPNEPTATGFGSVQLKDAIDPTWESPTTPEFPTTEGWINVLNPTATNLVFGSYIGGSMDEQVFAPYVDRFGDVWVVGSTVAERGYSRAGTTTVKNYDTRGPLPAGLISPLAFKAVGDQNGGANATLLYGGYQPDTGHRGGATGSPGTISVGYAKDGFMVKLRVSAPSVTSINLNPSTVPGGLGASTTGTVTLSSGAPAEGATIQLDLDTTTLASFSNSGQQSSTTVSIAPGGTTATFTIYTNAVPTTSAVHVKATYLGSFQIAQLNVVPWLQNLNITPDTTVGGNTISGRVTLAAVAPASGITVALSTDSPTLIGFPDPNNPDQNVETVTVAAGQTSATFNISTGGVSSTSFANVTASLLGVNRTAVVTLKTANILSLTFDPTVIPGLGTTKGTLKLDGKSGDNFPTVKLDLGVVPAGYRFYTLGAGGTKNYFSSVDGTGHTVGFLTIPSGLNSVDFYVETPFEATAVDRKVTASRSASGDYLAGSVSGTFRVSTAPLKSLTIAPTSVMAGETATGTVTLTQPAPTGGVVVNISLDPASNAALLGETYPLQVLVPEQATSVDFTIHTKVTAMSGPATVKFYASRDPNGSDKQPATLTINPVTISLSLDDTSLTGGRTTHGRVILAKTADTDIIVNLAVISGTSSLVSFPTTVTVRAGQTQSDDFTITTQAVASPTTLTIRAYLGANAATATVRSDAQITLMPIGVDRVRFIQAGSSTELSSISVKGGVSPAFKVRVYLNGASQTIGGTGTYFYIQLNNPSTAPITGLPQYPTKVFVPVGQTFVDLTANSKPVSRTVTVVVTAFTGTPTAKTSSASGSITVNKRS